MNTIFLQTILGSSIIFSASGGRDKEKNHKPAEKNFVSPSEGVAEGGGWGEEFRHARAVAKRFRRLDIKTSKQNNFQFFLGKFWRAGDKKLKENCFALLAEVRRAETRSGAIRAFFVQKRFELRSTIAIEFFRKRKAAFVSAIYTDTSAAKLIARKIICASRENELR